MSNKEWIESVKKIKDPVEMLKIILENESFFGFDPYYRELREAMTAQAETIVKESPQGIKSEPMEKFEDAKQLYNSDPHFRFFVHRLIGLMKDRILTPEQILTGVTLAIAEFEHVVEPQLEKPS